MNCLLLRPTTVFFLEAMKGLEPLSTGLQDRRSDSHLSYIARKDDFGSLCFVLCLLVVDSHLVNGDNRVANKAQRSKYEVREALVDRGGTQTLTCSLQDCHAVNYITRPCVRRQKQ
jgi:hypothetical protein